MMYIVGAARRSAVMAESWAAFDRLLLGVVAGTRAASRDGADVLLPLLACPSRACSRAIVRADDTACGSLSRARSSGCRGWSSSEAVGA